MNYGSPPLAGYDLEFYSPPDHVMRWKDNNDLTAIDTMAINISTGHNVDMNIDELMMSLTPPPTMTTPPKATPPIYNATSKPVLIEAHHVNNSNIPEQQNNKNWLLKTASTTLPMYSKLHEALTQPQWQCNKAPRLPTQPVKCDRCANELTSKCLMQTCTPPDLDETRCTKCGKELTAKCILSVCCSIHDTGQDTHARKESKSVPNF